MAPRRGYTREQILGFRPVPGYGRVTFLTPDFKPRSSRRFYNPDFRVGDPRREMSDSTYYGYVRRFEREASGYRQVVAAERSRRQFGEAEQREFGQAVKRPISMTRQQYATQQDNLSIISYQLDYNQVPPSERNMPGGALANQLEAMGLRPREAQWAVGDSDKETTARERRLYNQGRLREAAALIRERRTRMQEVKSQQVNRPPTIVYPQIRPNRI